MANIHEAKTHFSKLLAEVQAGRDVVITKAGRPIAKLVAYQGDPVRLRSPGGWQGRVRIAADFDQLPDELLDTFSDRTEKT